MHCQRVIIFSVVVISLGEKSYRAVDPSWSRIPMRTAILAAAGHMGGEGCQVLRDLQISGADPSFVLMG